MYTTVLFIPAESQNFLNRSVGRGNFIGMPKDLAVDTHRERCATFSQQTS
jgi:hypothetical protein